MINKYQYFSPGFNSQVAITYCDGVLSKVEIENPVAEHMKESKSFFFNKEEVFLEVCKKFKIAYTLLDREVTFDMFWDRYAYKVEKAEAMAAWKKLSRVNQQQAFDFIPHYEGHLKMTGLGKKYPATYLNKKTFIK